MPNHIAVSYLETVLASLTFWMNVLIIKYGWVNYALGVLWSLAVEEVFYLCFPILSRFSFKKWYFVAVMLSLIICTPFVRAYYFLDPNEAYLYHYFASFDAIAVGCLTALVSAYTSFKTPSFLKYCVIGLMLFIYFFAEIKWVCTWTITLFSLCVSYVILGNGSKVAPKKTILVWLGQQSYELYLFHLIVLGLIKTFFPPIETSFTMKIVLLSVYFVGAICLSSLIEKYYSTVLNRKIRQYFKL